VSYWRENKIPAAVVRRLNVRRLLCTYIYIYICMRDSISDNGKKAMLYRDVSTGETRNRTKIRKFSRKYDDHRQLFNRVEGATWALGKEEGSDKCAS